MTTLLEEIKQNLFKTMNEQKTPLVYLGEEDGDKLLTSVGSVTYRVKNPSILCNDYIHSEINSDSTISIKIKAESPSPVYAWIVVFQKPIKYKLFCMSFAEQGKAISILEYTQ